MRTIARETASHIALRNCSEEVGREVSIYKILVKGEYVQSSTHFGRRLVLVMRRLQLVTRSRCLR